MQPIFFKYLLLYFFLFLVTEVKSQTILSENFEGSFPPDGWTFTNIGGYAWQQDTYSFNAKSGAKSMNCYGSEFSVSNAWAFTPVLKLMPNTLYRISYWYRGAITAGNTESLKVTLGNENSIAAQTEIIHDYPSLINTSYVEGIDTFTVTTAGNYFLAFNDYSSAKQAGVYLDSIVVKQIIPISCTGTPIIGTASGPSTVRSGSNFSLSLSGNYLLYSGLEFQWQSTPMGQNVFKDIPGANSLNFTTSETTSNDYRCKVTCTNSSAFVVSNIVSVTLSNYGSLFRQKYLGSTDINARINGMFFLSPSTGFVAFSDRLGFTKDSGQTYTIRTITPANTDYNGYAVTLAHFTNRGVYAFSIDSLLLYGDFGAEPSILFSADQGLHWKLVFHQPFELDPDIENSFFDMKFISATKGMALNQKYIVETMDKGLTWAVKSQIFSYSNSKFAKLSVPSASVAYAIAGNSLYKRVNDYWYEVQNVLPTKTGLNFNNISFSSNTTGYISKDDNYAVYKTINGGDTWTKMNDTAACPVLASDLYFINDSTGFACTKYTYNVLKTTNNGVTWEVCKKNTSYQYENYGMERLFFLNNLAGWAGGQGEYLMLTTSGGSPTFPKAVFKIDTSNLASSGTVSLINSSNNFYQYKWYKNGVLISSSYTTNYIHDIYALRDTIMLIVGNGADIDTTVHYQDFQPFSQAPIITSFTPTSGITNSVVTITGIGFTGTTSVTFGGIPAKSFIVNSNTLITAIVAGGSSGNIEITAIGGTGVKTGFIYDSPSPPVVTSFLPDNGQIGTTVTINGNNFGTGISQNIVYFGKVKASIISANDSKIICTVPSGSSYDPISVVNISNHLSAATNKPFNITFPSNNIVTENAFERVLDIHVPSVNGIQGVPTSIIAGDIDGDGKNDLVTSEESGIGLKDSICIYRNNTNAGNISFESRKSVTGSSYFNAISDIDNDGKLDIEYVSSSGIGVLRNTSSANNISFANPVFAPTVTGPKEICVRDLDGDGRPEIIVAGYNERKLGILRNVSTSPIISFASKMEFPSAALAQTVATGDLDGDGKPDVAIGGEETLSIFRNTSSKEKINFNSRIDIPTTGDINKILITDVNGDGKLDIVVIYSSTFTSFSVLKNTSTSGNISFSPKIDFSGNQDNADVGAIDNFTGDSLPDIFYGSYYRLESVFQKNSSTDSVLNFFSPVVFGIGTNYASMCASDFDGDGKPDVATVDWNKTVNDYHILKNKIGTLTNADSITITTPDTNLCSSDSVTFSATASYSGSSISYQWVLNGINKGKDSNIYTAASLNNNDKVYCIITVDSTHTVQSNTITMSVKPNVTPAIVITTADTTICSGTTVTFTATATNGGATPLYQWQLNGINTGTNSNTFSSAKLSDNDKVTCVLTSNAVCSSPPTVSSNIIRIHVTKTPETAGVSITQDNFNICTGDTATFMATSTNGGNNPHYQWQVNGINTGNNSNIFASNRLVNGDVVKVLLTSIQTCASQQTVSSDSILVTVNSAIPLVSISPSSSSICYGEAITFTAIATNGGTTPVFQWKKNGMNVGTNSSTYSGNNFINGDSVSVTLFSNATCAIPSFVNSNDVVVTVAPASTATIQIDGITLVSPGVSSAIAATIINGGITPVYQWQDSTSTHSWMNINAATSPILNYTPSNTDDKLRCLLSINPECVSATTTISNTLTFTLSEGGTRIYFYPNPVKSKLTIDSLNIADEWQTLTIINTAGISTYFSKNIKRQIKIELGVANLPSGAYTGILRNKKGKVVFFKFIKI